MRLVEKGDPALGAYALDEGAAKHYVLKNRSLDAQTVFTWLDALFGGSDVAANPGRDASSVPKKE